MREIKFRAWDKEESRMYDIKRINFNYSVHYLSSEYLYEQKIENIELMQYTGLKDKNGKEIYEGDILEMLSLSERVKNLTFICAIDEFGVNFQANHPDRNNNRFGGNNLWWNSDDWIIKGNIYENPELLTK